MNFRDPDAFGHGFAVTCRSPVAMITRSPSPIRRFERGWAEALTGSETVIQPAGRRSNQDSDHGQDRTAGDSPPAVP